MEKFRGLNPYYSGSWFGRRSKKGERSGGGKSLNPYYSGSWVGSGTEDAPIFSEMS